MTLLAPTTLSDKHHRHTLVEKLSRLTKPYRLLETSLYHISFDDSLPTILTPQNPAGGDVTAEPSEISEPSLPRACFSTTIRGCVRAVFPNWKELVKKGDPITFNVYRANPKKNHPFITPNTLVDEGLVHDAHVTQEHITLEEVEIVFVCKATAYLHTDGEWLFYHLFGKGVGQQSHSPLNIDIELHGV